VPFAVLSLGVIFLLYQVVGGVITFLLMGTKLTPDNVSVVRWATMISQVLFILIPTVLLARSRTTSLTEFLRLRMPRVDLVLVSLVAVLALQQILSAYLLVQDAIPLPAPVERIVDQIRTLMEEMYRGLLTAHSLPEFLFVVLVIAVTPALCEEILFRGLVQGSLQETVRPLTAALVAGAIFGAYHINPFSMLPLMLLGAFFGFLVYRTGSLITAVIAHFFNNFVAALAMYLRLDEDFVAIAPTAAPTPGLVALNTGIAVLVFLAAMFYVVHRTSRRDDPGTEGGAHEAL
jgi:hypothetical protein